MTTQPIDSDSFRRALGSFTTGVTVVTTRDEAHGVDVGLTANSFNSVSLDPPLVLWSLAKSARSLDAFVNAEYFSIHVLAVDQEELSGRFASRGTDKFSGLAVERGPGNIPLLERYAARFVCRKAFQYEGGDHEIFVGEVVAFDHTGAAPLVYHGGQYGLVLRKAPQVTPERKREQVSNFGQDFLGYLLGRAYQQLFAPIRMDLSRRGLTVTDYYVLNLTARFDNLSLPELNRMLASADYQAAPELLLALQERGLVTLQGVLEGGLQGRLQEGLQGEGDEVRIHLTDPGRQLLIELVSIAKAVESDALNDLEFEERQTLKLLLRQVIRSSRIRSAEKNSD